MTCKDINYSVGLFLSNHHCPYELLFVYTVYLQDLIEVCVEYIFRSHVTFLVLVTHVDLSVL